jgi:hypothetical protein
MLYLFNSGFRPLYTRNVLNSLFLPEGCTNEYRYKYVGEPRYVPPAVYAKLPELSRGTDCVVTFIDRFAATGYSYHPLRRGKYLSYREAGGSVYFRIQLETFLYPRDFVAFGQHLRQALVPMGLPQLTGGDPENTNDGAYAILADSIFGQVSECLWGDEAWAAAVENLSDMRAFATNAEQSPVFIKVDVFPQSRSPKRISPIIRDDASVYKLKRNKRYELSVTYRFPRQRLDQGAKARAEINLGDNIRLLGNTSIDIDSYTNSLLKPFISARETEDTSGSISLAALDGPSQPKLLMPDSSVFYNIGDSAAFWLQIVVAGLLFSVAGAFIGLDFSKIAPFSPQAVLTVGWPKLTAGVIQALALFWVFRVVGKKVF